jgi:hypothetical protein
VIAAESDLSVNFVLSNLVASLGAPLRPSPAITQLSMKTAFGQFYDAQYSNDLTNWITFARGNIAKNINVTDSSATNENRSYRVVITP